MEREIKLGVWQKEKASSGLKYYFGQRDGVKVTIFKNNRKQSDRDPDLNLIVKIEEGGNGGGAPSRQDDPDDGYGGITDDDIPFD